jgi:hypothetical protein
MPTVGTGISPDVLATALQELMPSYSELFAKWHPVLDRIINKGNMDRSVLKGPFREFAVVTGGPGSVTQVVTGSEVIAGGRNQAAARGDTYAPRLIYAFDVPGKDLAEANGEMDLARIIQHYPELALADFHERISEQFAQGTGPGVAGFATLNGATTYSPNGAARSGAIKFGSRVAQQTGGAPLGTSDQRYGLTSGGTDGWYNQWGDIPAAGFAASNGRSTMRQVYFAAARQMKTMGPVDLLLGDEASYLNYLDSLDSQVRIISDSTKAGDRAPKQIRQGVKFLDADFYLEDSIDITSTAWNQAGDGTPNAPANAANDGVIYFINTACWHAYTLGHDASRETKGDFSVRGPFRIPEQDLFRYEIVLNMGIHTNQLRANGAVTGSAIA